MELTAALSLAIFNSQESTQVYFVLGPSPLRPMETYSLACSAVTDVVAESDARSYARTNDISRKVLRSLITNTASAPEGKASSGISIPVLCLVYTNICRHTLC